MHYLDRGFHGKTQKNSIYAGGINCSIHSRRIKIRKKSQFGKCFYNVTKKYGLEIKQQPLDKK